MANDQNALNIIGRLTRDPSHKTTQTGTSILSFSIANNQRRKQGDTWEDEAHFFDVVMVGKGAEALARYLTKGKQIAISGQLRQNRWQNKDGENRSKVEIFAQQIQLLGGGEAGHAGGSGPGGSEPPAFDNSFNEDIPF